MQYTICTALKNLLKCDFRCDLVCYSQGHSSTDDDGLFVVLYVYESVIVYLELPFAL